MQIIMNNNLLRNNGLYIAALADLVDGTNAIIVDSHYYGLPSMVQQFILAHEHGHINQQKNETVADKYAMSQIGKIKTFISMMYLFNYFLSIDWTVSAQYLVRMSNLGFKVNLLKIKSPNGMVWSADDLRPYMDDNYVVM